MAIKVSDCGIFMSGKSEETGGSFFGKLCTWREILTIGGKFTLFLYESMEVIVEKFTPFPGNKNVF